jgi:hypothetical protein
MKIMRLTTSLFVLNAIALVGATAWVWFARSLEALVASAMCASTLLAQVIHYKRAARLKIELNPGAPCEQTEPAGANGLAIRVFSVAVTNAGEQSLDDCLVKLYRIKALDGAHLEAAYLPIGLRTQHQHLQGRRGGPFNLRAGETKYVRVAGMDETVADSEIALQYEDGGLPNLIRRGDFLITLRAYGTSVVAEESFRLFVSPGGQLRMRRYR